MAPTVFSRKDKSAISMTSCKPAFAIRFKNSVDLDHMALSEDS